YLRRIARQAVAWRRHLGLDDLQRIARRIALGDPEELQDAAELLRSAGIAGHFHMRKPQAQRRERLRFLRSELLRQFVLGILGPGQPDLSDLQPVERRLGLDESGK